NGDPSAVLRTQAAEVGRVDQFGPVGGELGDESVRLSAVGVVASADRLLEGVLGGEIDRLREAGHVGVAKRIDGDGVPLVRAGTAQVGRVGQHRVDHQRPAVVVGADPEADLAGRVQDVAAGDRTPACAGL